MKIFKLSFKRYIVVVVLISVLSLSWITYRCFFVKILITTPNLIVTHDMHDIKDYREDFNASNKTFNRILQHIKKNKNEYYKIIYLINIKNTSSKATVGYFCKTPKFSDNLKKYIIFDSVDGLVDGVSDIGPYSEEIQPLSNDTINYFIVVKYNKKDKKELYKLIQQSTAKVQGLYSSNGIVGFTLYSGITSTNVSYAKVIPQYK